MDARHVCCGGLFVAVADVFPRFGVLGVPRFGSLEPNLGVQPCVLEVVIAASVAAAQALYHTTIADGHQPIRASLRPPSCSAPWRCVLSCEHEMVMKHGHRQQPQVELRAGRLLDVREAHALVLSMWSRMTAWRGHEACCQPWP